MIATWLHVNKKMYVLTQNKQHFSTLHYGNHPYKVVFKDVSHALSLQGQRAQRINIKRSGMKPLDTEYYQRMMQFGVPDWNMERISMDNQSLVTFTLNGMEGHAPFDMKQFSMYETMLLPGNHCGVIIPQLIVEHTHDTVVFQAHVIDPLH